MASAAELARVFKNEALNVIWGEILRMRKEKMPEFVGVSFSCGGNWDISVSYVLDRGSSFGQAHQYPNSLWPCICLAMKLTGYLAMEHNYLDLAQLSSGVGFNSTRWSIYLDALGEHPLEKLAMLLHRVDDTILLLYAPLDLSAVVPAQTDCLS